MLTFSWRPVAVAVISVLPWLNPLAPGPSPWVGPWLFSALCGTLVFALGARARPHDGIAIVLAGVVAWAAVRSGWPPETIALAGGCLLVWLAATLTAAAERVEVVGTIALAWLAAATISTAAALTQYFGFSDSVAPWVNLSPHGEAYANLRQRNQFASLTVIGVAALLWLTHRGLPRWAGYVAMVWLALGNAATTSRTGLLQLLLLGAFALCWSGLRSLQVRLWLIAVATYCIGALALPLLAQAITGEPASSLWSRIGGTEPCSSRQALWLNVLTLVRERPWFGWGWGQLDFAHFATLYTGDRFCDILDNAHNLPLHFAVELGIPAAIAICGVIAAALARRRPWLERDTARQLAWSVLLVLGVHSLLEYPMWYGPFQMTLGYALGVLWPAPTGRSRSSQIAEPWPTFASALACIGLAFAAWDYHRVSQLYLPPEDRAAAYQDATLAKAQRSVLFARQAKFAELSITPLTRANAASIHELALDMLHFSPEPKVIEAVIDSALQLRDEDSARWHMLRYRAAFPTEYAAWLERAGGTSGAHKAP